MKKLFLITLLTLFFFFSPKLVWAACDPYYYDESNQYTVEITENCNSGDCVASQAPRAGFKICWPLKATPGSTPVTEIKPKECKGSTAENPIIETALGCIAVNPQAIVAKGFEIAIFVGSGIAFMLLTWGAFLLITSQGNPEQITQGKDIIVSAGTGLLFIIFSIFLFRLIGVDILKIPGFS